MKAVRIIIINVFRVVIALTFILSGFVKAVDPHGTQYKIQDYLTALGHPGAASDFVALLASMTLSGIEFIMGVLLLFAVRRKWLSRYIVVFLLFMTGVSAWLWIENPISDCGCFGDAIHLTNLQTFLKNIILLAMSIIVAIWPKDMIRLISHSNFGVVLNYSLVFVIGLCSYSLYTLPPFDFRPYHIGANIKKGMEMPEGKTGPQFETTFIMKKDGVTKEFTLENYPDSTWEYVDTKSVKVADGYEPPIHDFILETQEGDDITEEVLNDTTYSFLLVAPHLEDAEDTYFGTLDQIYAYCQDNGYKFYCLTASGEKAIEEWKNNTGATYPFCSVDEITLKTIIRSNPGLVLLKNGTVINKWSHNNLPNKELVDPLEKLELSKPVVQDLQKKILYWLMLYFAPLLAFSILDRIYTGTKWSVNKYKAYRDKKKEEKKARKEEEQEKKAEEQEQEPEEQETEGNKTDENIDDVSNQYLELEDDSDSSSDEDEENDESFNISQFKNNKTMRKKIVAGNWKMNKNLQEGIELATELNEALAAEKPNCDVVICTPFIHLAKVSEVINHEVINLGAENCADKASGAYTGEVSAEMVKSTGCEYVILGHSERREYYHETPEILKEKVDLALANGLKILFCIGESLEQREANEQEAVCRAELEGSVFHLTAEQFANVVIAYEPIWAIGTGKTATSDQAEEIHAYIRSVVAEKYGAEVADNTSILYGGSCKASNAPELFAKPDIDGGLIGGASLKCADFKGIIDAWK